LAEKGIVILSYYLSVGIIKVLKLYMNSGFSGTTELSVIWKFS